MSEDKLHISKIYPGVFYLQGHAISLL